MKSINVKCLRDFEYRIERSQEKKQTRQMRDQRKNRKAQWTNIVGYD